MRSKPELRRLLLARRAGVPAREDKASRIASLVLALPEFQAARLVSSYVGVGDEVATGELLRAVLERGSRLVVPWRDGTELKLAEIRTLDELEPASFGLLEPSRALGLEREVRPDTVDLLLVPGVAFDRSGGRLGHGRAFYDGLLSRCRPDAVRVGLGFGCQVLDQVPMEAHDQRMDLLVTEEGVLRFSARTASEVR